MVYFVCILYFLTLVDNSFHFIGFPEFGKSAERPGISASDFSGADLILTEISRNLLSSGPSYFDLYFAKVSARPSFPRAATRDGDPIVSRPHSGFKFKDVCVQIAKCRSPGTPGSRRHPSLPRSSYHVRATRSPVATTQSARVVGTPSAARVRCLVPSSDGK